ncbi:TIGR02391 family protein [Corynebacterium pseudodiphtheriticum]|uniref:TIGR02391 family protein n=1 Tax=Corynebacterium pseudodiphtheriticum TaxID=37637 RepID=UPI00234CE2A6|nr:TIGR02391 family protein [Corynebacterium pseudodiphtheriticum]MDC7113662.1 TIGR02391 family protein [Corynebacterium pseudodiphtheriticum]
MNQSASFLQRSTIRNIANVLASTEPPGLSGNNINQILHDIDAPPRGDGSKREGLFAALTNAPNPESASQRTQDFIAVAMSPARYTNKRQKWEDLRLQLNQVLVTGGWHINDTGQLAELPEVAHTFDDIDRLTNFLMEELRRRGTHDRLLNYCSRELITQSLFHAISEAAKSIPDHIRSLTGLTDDGHDLFEIAFGTKKSSPRLFINDLSTKSDESELRGFKNLLVGIHGHYRNPRAHQTRLGSEEDQHDFLDAFSLFSYVHRRLDSAQIDQSFI